MRLGAIMGLGLAYAGTRREEVTPQPYCKALSTPRSFVCRMLTIPVEASKAMCVEHIALRLDLEKQTAWSRCFGEGAAWVKAYIRLGANPENCPLQCACRCGSCWRRW